MCGINLKVGLQVMEMLAKSNKPFQLRGRLVSPFNYLFSVQSKVTFPPKLDAGVNGVVCVTSEPRDMKTFLKTVCVSLYLQMRSDSDGKFVDQFNLALLN